MTSTPMLRALPRRLPIAARLSAVALALATLVAPARAQFGSAAAIPDASRLVQVRQAAAVEIPAGGTATAVLRLLIEPGWHINANPASPDYMIATEVKVAPARGVSAGAPRYPEPHDLKVGFEEQPLKVYDGEVEVRVPLRAAADAAAGEVRLGGTVTFQSCNDQVCLAPTDVRFTIEAVVVAGAAGGASPGGTPDPGAPAAASPEGGAEEPPAPADAAAESLGGAISTGPDDPGRGIASGVPAGASFTDRFVGRLTRELDRGGPLSFVLLFVAGLLLNLTPCVYPMLGVTVSIFGARRAAPTAQVMGAAALYVLGIATMYTSLGVAAALTGGLFGGLLANPVVLVGIGVLFFAMSLSMFGLYELQPPPALLSRLGGAGAGSAFGVFLSGLVVGVFAAPCIGPPVVALLAHVAGKADWRYGFATFFTLALGLGAPYLVLATWSGLLQRLPRSGEWMVWVKKLFGVILLALGAFYVLNALAPSLTRWVAPLALLAGGLYLGFLEKSGLARPRFAVFKRMTGALAALAAVVMVVTTPKETLAFRAYDPGHLEQVLSSGRPAMLDFSAEWCIPCHELDRQTFTDRRVIEAAREFEVYKVDLTRYDSPEAEAWRRQYGITGVPTVLFLTPDGREVREARVEGFLPADPFLERMAAAQRASLRARR